MGMIPEELRPAIASALDDLVEGRLPERMTWVHQYAGDGATLIRQPEEIWTHTWTALWRHDSGGWRAIVPLWTTEESPSDLSAEIAISADGQATIEDVHVL